MVRRPECLRLALLVGLALWPLSAAARPLRPIDLKSLSLDADAIVRVTYVHVEGAESFRVDQVFKGALIPGETIRVSSRPRESGREAALQTRRLEAEYLFLKKHGSKAKNSRILFTLGPSCRRVVIGDETFRVDREWAFTPQGEEPRELTSRAWGQPTNPVSRNTFEKQLREAISLAARVERDLAAPPSAERTQRLIESLSPPSGRLPIVVDTAPITHSFGDRLSTRVLMDLRLRDDPVAFVEAASRGWERVEVCRRRCDLDVLTVAQDRKRSLLHRTVALRVFQSNARAISSRLSDLKPLLLSDPAVEVRAVAAQVLGRALASYRPLSKPESIEQTKLVASALIEAWRRERDPLVRSSIVGAFGGNQVAIDQVPESNPLPDNWSLAEFSEVVKGRVFLADHVEGWIRNRERRSELFLVVEDGKGREVRRLSRKEFDPLSQSGETILPDAADSVLREGRFYETGAFYRRWRRGTLLVDPPLEPGEYRFRFIRRIHVEGGGSRDFSSPAVSPRRLSSDASAAARASAGSRKER
ncbi:MAG: hypothetical protein AAF517_25425 [Planctomycetota bacterium]